MKEVYYKTRLSDGRFIGISPNKNKTSEEYIFIVGPDSKRDTKLPVLLSQRNNNIQFFSKFEDTYLKTELNKEDSEIIKGLIRFTDLNKFSFLFGEVII